MPGTELASTASSPPGRRPEPPVNWDLDTALGVILAIFAAAIAADLAISVIRDRIRRRRNER